MIEHSKRGTYMRTWLKLLISSGIVLSGSSILWFLLGSTAYFQRGMDIIGTTHVILVVIPLSAITLLFLILFIKGWVPTRIIDYIIICVVLLITIFLSLILIQSVFSNGWTKEKIENDSLQITTDGKYEYRIELINLFQRNSHERLYVEDINTGERKYIPIDINTKEINGIALGDHRQWGKLEPIQTTSQYILTTTEDLPVPKVRFEINIRAGTSVKLE